MAGNGKVEELSLSVTIETELQSVPEAGKGIAELVIKLAKDYEKEQKIDDREKRATLDMSIINTLVDGIQLLCHDKAEFEVDKTKVEPIYDWDDYQHVESVQQLREVILQAKEANETTPTKVRIIGSGHAPKRSREGIGSDEAQVKCILTGEFRKLEYKLLPVGKDGEEMECVIAGAGIHLGDDPLDPTVTWDDSLLVQLAERNMALNDLGGITNQTIAGFMGTGGRQVYVS